MGWNDIENPKYQGRLRAKAMDEGRRGAIALYAVLDFEWKRATEILKLAGVPRSHFRFLRYMKECGPVEEGVIWESSKSFSTYRRKLTV